MSKQEKKLFRENEAVGIRGQSHNHQTNNEKMEASAQCAICAHAPAIHKQRVVSLLKLLYPDDFLFIKTIYSVFVMWLQVSTFFGAALKQPDDPAGQADDDREGEQWFGVCADCDVVCTAHRSKLEARMAQAFADAADVERAGEGKQAADARRLRWKRVRSAAGALKKRAGSLPAKQADEYRELLRSHFGTDDLDDPHVQWLWYAYSTCPRATLLTCRRNACNQLMA